MVTETLPALGEFLDESRAFRHGDTKSVARLEGRCILLGADQRLDMGRLLDDLLRLEASLMRGDFLRPKDSGREERATKILNLALDATLFVSASWSTGTRREMIVPGKLEEARMEAYGAPVSLEHRPICSSLYESLIAAFILVSLSRVR